MYNIQLLYNFSRIGTHEKIIIKKKDNLHTLRKGLDSLIKETENKEIIIKPANKG